MAKAKPAPASGRAPPRIYEARLERDGGVRRVREVSLTEAVDLRRRGVDVVVCGRDVGSNRTLAASLEQQANGRWVLHRPHANAGLAALPHVQPEVRPPSGHTFYETNQRKAR